MYWDKEKTSLSEQIILKSTAQTVCFVGKWSNHLKKGTEKYQYKISEAYMWPGYNPQNLLCFSKAEPELNLPVNIYKNKQMENHKILGST